MLSDNYSVAAERTIDVRRNIRKVTGSGSVDADRFVNMSDKSGETIASRVPTET